MQENKSGCFFLNIVYRHFFTNHLVKEFWKSVHILPKLSLNIKQLFFGTRGRMRYSGDETKRGSLNQTFVGTSDPTACLGLLQKLVYKADPSLCQPKPCAIGAFYQPTLPPNMDFYAVGGFIWTLRSIGALDQDGRYIPSVGFEKAFEYCQKVQLLCITWIVFSILFYKYALAWTDKILLHRYMDDAWKSLKYPGSRIFHYKYFQWKW